MTSDAAAVPTLSLPNQLSAHVGWLFLLSDMLSVVSGYFLATKLTDSILGTTPGADPSGFYEFLGLQKSTQVYILGFGLSMWFAIKGHYTSRHPLTTEGYEVLVGASATGIVDAYVQFALPNQSPQIWSASTWLLSGLLILASRLALKHALFRLGPWQCPVILVGSKSAIEESCCFIGHDPYIGQVVSCSIIVGRLCEVRDRLEAALNLGACRYVLIAFDGRQQSEVAAVARLIDEELQVPYGITVGLRNISNGRFELQKSFGHDLILIHNYPIKWIGYKKTIKRLFDILGASVILFCLSVPLLVIALLVRLDGGPVFYSSARIGRAGRLFYALKFRSMVPDADKILSDMLVSDHALKQEWETNFKLKSDPRITRIGRILRSTSLDEVPQLLNVLRGEMSLVGPRPILPDERNQYTGHAFNLYSRVTPGLTGVWQVSGRDHLNYNSRIELNNWYIANWSLWVDLVILCRTLIVVVRRVGAS